jgi:Skp family chaperone for outer membrane proteins
VKRSPFVAALAASVFALLMCISLADAQQPAPARGLQPGPANIAFLDLNKVIKSHARFTMMTTELKQAVSQAGSEIEKERNAIKALMDRLAQYGVGSVEYKQLEAEIAQRQSTLSVNAQMQRRDLMRREAQNHFSVYQEVMQEVEYFAANNGIAAVMQFDGTPVDKQNPDSVGREITKSVLWFPAGCDITDFIISRVNRADLNTGRAANNQPSVPTGPAQR